MELIDLGYGSAVNADRVIAVSGADTAPMRRMISAAREKNLVIDTTCGRKTQSVVVMDSGHIVLSAKSTERLLEKGKENE